VKTPVKMLIYARTIRARTQGGTIFNDYSGMGPIFQKYQSKPPFISFSSPTEIPTTAAYPAPNLSLVQQNKHWKPIAAHYQNGQRTNEILLGFKSKCNLQCSLQLSIRATPLPFYFPQYPYPNLYERNTK